MTAAAPRAIPLTDVRRWRKPGPLGLGVPHVRRFRGWTTEAATAQSARAVSPPLPLPHGAVLAAPERWGRYKGVEVTQKGRKRDGTGAAGPERPTQAPSRGPHASRDPEPPLPSWLSAERLDRFPPGSGSSPGRAPLFPQTAPPSALPACPPALWPGSSPGPDAEKGAAARSGSARSAGLRLRTFQGRVGPAPPPPPRPRAPPGSCPRVGQRPRGRLRRRELCGVAER